MLSTLTRTQTYTRTPLHHPFLKPPLNPSIEEGERRNRAKKKERNSDGRAERGNAERRVVGIRLDIAVKSLAWGLGY
jgi:hypothetical protein